MVSLSFGETCSIAKQAIERDPKAI